MVSAHLGRRMPTNCVVAVLAVGTHGTWTRSFSRSGERNTPSGERWIRMETCSICGSQSRRNKKAAKRFFRKLLTGLQYVPRVIIPDKLKSYAAAKREILPGVEHRQHKRLGHPSRKLASTPPPTRLREKNMRKFKSARACATLSRAYLRSFSTATTPSERKGISCHFTGSIPAME